jgi:hypothetical protein
MARVLPGTAPPIGAHSQADMQPAFAWIEAHYGTFRGQWVAVRLTDPVFGLTWEQEEPVHIATVVGAFWVYLHVVGMQIDRFTWEAPVAIAEFESLPGALPRQVLGLIGFFEWLRVTTDAQDEHFTIEPRF